MGQLRGFATNDRVTYDGNRVGIIVDIHPKHDLLKVRFESNPNLEAWFEEETLELV